MKSILFVFLVFLFYSDLRGQQHDFALVDFKRADSVAALYEGHALSDIRGLAIKLTQPFSSEEEKFRALYTWTCNNIEYDYALYVKNKRKEKIHDANELKAWNKEFNVQVFKRLLNKKKTACTGYAYLVMELASHAGITCVIVDGYGRTADANVRGRGKVDHSWNAVKLKGKWYLCDPTWSSGAMDMRTTTFVKNYDDAYFLADPSLFIRNHYPVDSAWMLLREKPTLSTFLNAALIYKAAVRYNITPLTQQGFDLVTNKGRPVSFQFAARNADELDQLTMYSESPDKRIAFHTPLYRDGKGVYCSDVAFNSKGKHLVHVLVKDNYAYTYTVQVK